MAQDDSKADVFAGYSFVHVSPQNQANATFNVNGGDAQVADNFTPRFAGVAEFAGYAGGKNGFSSTIIAYMFGPRISFRHDKWTPFVQAVFGGGRIQFPQHQYSNAFAMAVGGGVDYNLNTHWAVRPAQIDFFETKFNDGHNNRQLNFRYSGGIVYRF